MLHRRRISTRTLAVLAGVALVALLAAGAVLVDRLREPAPAGTAAPAGDVSTPSTVPGPPTATPSASPSPSPSVTRGPRSSPPATRPAEAAPAAGGRHPTPATTGVRPGTRLRTLRLNDGEAHRIRSAGTVLDGVHIPGSLLITAPNVTIRNSQIDGQVLNEYENKTYPFTITDSTVGPADGCLTSPGVGEAQFTATRVHVRGHGDGFRASGDDITIRDSYVHLCSSPGDHSDGIQAYVTGRNLVLHNTTIDQRDARDITAPIFLVDEGQENVTVTDNLVMGGTYSIQVRNSRGRVIVRNNMLVDKSWVYGPIDADCDTIEWSGNALVTIDGDYRITSVVRPLPCDT